jgi:hypothetical protein
MDLRRGESLPMFGAEQRSRPSVVDVRIPDKTLAIPAGRALGKLHLADFKVPQYVVVRDQPLPRSSVGQGAEGHVAGRDYLVRTAALALKR